MNLDNYETVKERKKRFYKDYPDGRIIVEALSDNILDHAFFKALIYLNINELKKCLPKAVGFALEIRDVNKSLSGKGKEYESVNYTSWTENCEESAIGRALDNGGYSGNDKCSKDEMEKAKRMSNIKPSQPVNKPSGDASPCKKCGALIIWKLSKNNKHYAVDIEGGEFHSKTCGKTETTADTTAEKTQIMAAIGELMKDFNDEETELCREEIRCAQTQGDLEGIYKHYKDLLEMRNNPEMHEEIF